MINNEKQIQIQTQGEVGLADCIKGRCKQVQVRV
jgi:hypothetical protein